MPLQVELEGFEAIFKQQRHQLPSQLKSLVAIVVLVVQFAFVFGSLDDLSNHKRQVPAFSHEAHGGVNRGNVGQDHVLQNIQNLVNFAGVALTLGGLDLACDVEQSLVLGEYIELRSFLNG